MSTTTQAVSICTGTIHGSCYAGLDNDDRAIPMRAIAGQRQCADCAAQDAQDEASLAAAIAADAARPCPACGRACGQGAHRHLVEVAVGTRSTRVLSDCADRQADPVNAAVEKMFGARCFWHADSGVPGMGQVFRSLRGNGSGASSVTGCVRVAVSYAGPGALWEPGPHRPARCSRDGPWRARGVG